MKNQILFALSALLLSATPAFADDSAVTGTVKSPVPSQVDVIQKDGSHAIYNYLPASGVNYARLEHGKPGEGSYLKINGPIMSMCMNHLLGVLAQPIPMTIETKQKDVIELTIPAASEVYSTCPQGSREAEDLTFHLPDSGL